MRYSALLVLFIFLINCKTTKKSTLNNSKEAIVQDSLYIKKSKENRTINSAIATKKENETVIVIYKGKKMPFSEYKKVSKKYDKADVIRDKEEIKKYKVSEKCKVLIIVD